MKHINEFTKFITEELEYHKILNPAFWQDDAFDPETRKKLLQIANDFYDDLKVDAPIVDVLLIGSMVNYSWSQYSDLDIHVVIDFSKVDKNTELVADALNGKKFIWNLRHPVIIKGYDVELYVQDINHKHISAGTYSMLTGKWITQPKWDPPSIDNEYIADKVASYEREIVEIDKLADKPTDADDAKHILNRVKVLKGKITKARDASLKKDGEFSIENLVFKELRHTGWIKKLIDLGSKAYSAIYSDSKPRISESRVKMFSQFIFEDHGFDEETKQIIAQDLKNLIDLVDAGLIQQSMLDAKRREIYKRSVNHKSLLSDPILGPLIAADTFRAMQTPQFTKLMELGYIPISTAQQVLNGTVILRHPISATFTIGVFNSGQIRRMALGTQNPTIYKMHGIGVQKYIEAFEWIGNMLDTTDKSLDTHKSVAAYKKRSALKISNKTTVKSIYLGFGIPENVYDEDLASLVDYEIAIKNGSEASQLVRLIKKIVSTGILPLPGTAYNQVFTPTFEKYIIDNQINWTMLIQPSGWSYTPLGGIQTSYINIDPINAHYQNPYTLTLGALPYFKAPMLSELGPSRSRTNVLTYRLKNIPTVTQTILQPLIDAEVSDSTTKIYAFDELQLNSPIDVDGIASFYKCKVNTKVSATFSGEFEHSNTISLSLTNGTGIVNYIVHGQTQLNIVLPQYNTVTIHINGIPLAMLLRKVGKTIDDLTMHTTSTPAGYKVLLFVDFTLVDAAKLAEDSRGWNQKDTPIPYLLINSTDMSSKFIV